MRVRVALIVGMALMLVGIVCTGAAQWFGWIVPQFIGCALFLLGIFAVALWGNRCPRCGQRLGFKREFFMRCPHCGEEIYKMWYTKDNFEKR